ncbi:MAG: hypothetical protein IJO70_02755 [Lachnospiraceae bacterium]|nr:hypothetical protein [Lachnospiraceae bacterium]
MKTLDAAYKEIYGENLKKYGFVKLKGRQPYFVRLIGEEIVQVITYINEWCEKKGCKAFTILCGVATVYRERLTLDWSPTKNTDWLISLRQIYAYSTYPNIDKEYSKSIDSFIYRDGDEASIYNALNNSFDYTEKLILPVLDDIVDLKTCMKYFHKFRMKTVLYGPKDNFGKNNKYSYYQEGMLNYLLFNFEEYKILKEKQYEETIENIKINLNNTIVGDIDAELNRNKKLHWNMTNRQIMIFKEVCQDKSEWEKVHIELDKRKNENINELNKYGLL